MFDIALDTLMLPIEREVAADIRKRLSSLSWRPNQIAVIRTANYFPDDPYLQCRIRLLRHLLLL